MRLPSFVWMVRSVLGLLRLAATTRRHCKQDCPCENEQTKSPGVSDSIGRPSTKVPDGKHSSTTTSPKWSCGQRVSRFALSDCTEATTMVDSSEARFCAFSISAESPVALAILSCAWVSSSSRCARTSVRSPFWAKCSASLAKQIVFPAPVIMTRSVDRRDSKADRTP